MRIFGMRKPQRDWVVAIAIAIGATFAADGNASERSANARREVQAFTVLRDGSPIGEHRVVLTRDGLLFELGMPLVTGDVHLQVNPRQ